MAEAALAVRHYRMAFAVLEACHDARTFEQFRQELVVALARTYRVGSTTFFVGDTTQLACLDPDPIINGITRTMLPEYQAVWHRHDLFASSETQGSLHTSRVASLSELTTLSDSPRHYVSDYLYRHDINCAAALSLSLPNGREALIGLFDRDRNRLGPGEIASLRLLAHPLNRFASTVLPAAGAASGSGQATTTGRLSPRQVQVAELVSQGLSNRGIAEALSIHEDSVKKYVSRILHQSGCRNRTELALLVRRAG